MNPAFTSDIERFIYVKCFDRIYSAVCDFVSDHPASLELPYCRLDCPDEATVEDMLLEFTANIVIDEETLSFDAVVSCTLTLEQEMYHDRESCESSQWFKVSCSVDVTEQEQNISIHNVEVYSGYKKKPTVTGVLASGNIVPRVYPDGLDDEATKFLSLYCPEALVTPMPVPIEDIVREHMGLDIIKGGRLTGDLSIFGQICFSPGKVKVYDIFDGKENDLDVRRGTILIDAYTFWERNLGCVNNTIAHEAYHWYRHRVYAAIKSILKGEKFIACRCPTKRLDEKKHEEWTDEQRMEWQANNVAPRILMPIQTVKPMIEELYQKYGLWQNGADRSLILECVIDELAGFYNVSKQSAKIRMIDLGYREAEGVYNFEDFTSFYAGIGIQEAFREYRENEDFRAAIDTGMFRYVNGYFVINNDLYITKDGFGQPSLTDYAIANLNECVLQFTNVAVVTTRYIGPDDPNMIGLVMTRKETSKRAKFKKGQLNEQVLVNADELKAAFEKKVAFTAKTTKSFSQRVMEYVEDEGWDAHKFSRYTNLELNHFYRIKRGEENSPSVETVLNICIGLQLSASDRDELLTLAGHRLQNSDKHLAYGFVFEAFPINTVAEFNSAYAVLCPNEQPPLKCDE